MNQDINRRKGWSVRSMCQGQERNGLACRCPCLSLSTGGLSRGLCSLPFPLSYSSQPYWLQCETMHSIIRTSIPLPPDGRKGGNRVTEASTGSSTGVLSQLWQPLAL